MISFTIPGTAIPQGSKTAYVVKGRAVLVDSNPKLKAWRKTVTLAARSAFTVPFTDAVGVRFDFYMPRPKTVTRDRPSVMPDLDKLIRAMGDGITDSGVWADDGLVVEIGAAEWYSDIPRVDVQVWSVPVMELEVRER